MITISSTARSSCALAACNYSAKGLNMDRDIIVITQW